MGYDAVVYMSKYSTWNSTYRNSICSVTAWPFMRSKNCLYFFFQDDTSKNFLILLLSYFPVFWLQISSTFAIIFADFHGLSCSHVPASSYTALFRVCLGGVGLRCVGLAQKISPFSLFVLLFSSLHYHTFVFFIPSARSLRFESRLWEVNIDQNWNPFPSLFVSENSRNL